MSVVTFQMCGSCHRNLPHTLDEFDYRYGKVERGLMRTCRRCANAYFRGKVARERYLMQNPRAPRLKPGRAAKKRAAKVLLRKLIPIAPSRGPAVVAIKMSHAEHRARVAADLQAFMDRGGVVTPLAGPPERPTLICPARGYDARA